MNKILIISILLSGSFFCHAQNNPDTIEIRKTFATTFRLNNKNLTLKQLLDITHTNAAAYQEMKKAKSNFDAGYVFGFAGGFLIGWPIGTTIGGGKPNWTLAAVGAALAAVSIPFSSAYNKHAKNAIKLYNSGLQQTGFKKIKFKYYLAANSTGLRITF
ncbi:MAG: hypothetical protein ACM3VS_00510 [Candidatus Dadabacteria bacterium]